MSKRRGSTASLGHTRLTEWGDRYWSLGRSGSSPLGRLMSEAGEASGGTHSDPTVAQQIRDEPVYECDAAVQAVAQDDPDIAWILVLHYVYGETTRDLAQRFASTVDRVSRFLLQGQTDVGAQLSERRRQAG